MKKLFVLAFLLVGLLSINSYAQEAADEEITEEELKKFATMEDSVTAFYEKKNEEVIEMIKNHEVIEPGRYNEIKDAWGDEAKLTEIEITPEEKTAYEGILAAIDAVEEEVTELKVSLIKNDEVLGIPTYNKVNKAYKEDPEVKEKVDALTMELKENRTPKEEVTDPGV
jgi:Asp-tRNA(Asn)/Glu-tRNA(Gln) amidotransferase C subunit